MRYPKILSVFFTFVLALTGITVAQAAPAEAASVTQVPSAGAFVPAKAATALATTQANAGVVANRNNTGFVMAVNKRSITSGDKVKFSVRNFTNAGKARTGKVQLQYYRSGKWQTAKTLTLKDGRTSHTRAVKNSLQWRYRYPATGAVTKTVTVTVKGSVLRTTTSATKKTNISLTASRTSRLATQSSKLTAKYYRAGKLQKKGNLYLQYKSGSRWITVSTMKINSKGVASKTVKPAVNRTYRVVNSNRKVVSPARKVTLKSGFTITPNKTSTTKGKGVRFTAEYYANGKPRTGKVQLQFHKNGKWNTRKTLTLKNGKVAYTTKPSTTLKWRFYHPGLKKGTKSVKVSVKPQLTLATNKTKLTSGASAKLTVKMTRNGTNVKSEAVSLQTQENGKWTTLQSVTVKKGTASVTVKPTGTTNYRVLAKGNVKSAVRTVQVTNGGNNTPANGKAFWVNTSAGLNLRTGAGTNFATIGSQLQYGEKVTTISSEAIKNGSLTWVNIKTSDGRVGWVADMYLSATDPATGKNKSFTITGSGYGHGIGMSQYGAYEMARQGNNVTKILTYYYTGTTVSSQTIPTGLRDVKIQVLGPETFGFNSSYGDKFTTRTLTFSDTSGGLNATWRLRGSDNSFVSANGSQHLPASYKLRITVSGTNVKSEVLAANNQVLATLTDSMVRVYPSATGVVTVPGANGRYNNGSLEISVISKVLNVSNKLKLNTEYLYGIAEMPSSWGSNGGGAALEAQAIAARTYALNTARTKAADIAKCNCNLVDDIRHQNFTGWRKQGEGTNQQWGNVWKAAVDRTVNSATSGQVVKHNGAYISTYYFSSSGGKTANSQDVWAATLPYLKAKDDKYSLNAPGNSKKSWTKTITQATARKAFPSLPDVDKLEVTAKYSSGQVKTMRATSSDGKTQTLTKKADQWRSTFGTDAAWFTSIK